MQKVPPPLVLRLGLAAVFLYAGVNILINPAGWIGFVPQWIESVPFLSRSLALQTHAVFELLLTAALVAGIRKKEIALLAFLDLVLVLIFYGIDDVTFRDLGLLAAALALFLLEKDEPAKTSLNS